MPHGPANAVLVAAPAHNHGPWAVAAGSGPTCSGCPDRNRVMSGSGPCGPLFNGVWQSLQPTTLTRYSPRLTASVGAGVDAETLVSPALHPTEARARPAVRPAIKLGTRYFFMCALLFKSPV